MLMVFRVVLEGEACLLAGEGRTLCAHENGRMVVMKLDLLTCSDTALQYQLTKPFLIRSYLGVETWQCALLAAMAKGSCYP